MKKYSLQEAKEIVKKKIKWKPRNKQEEDLIAAAILDLTHKEKKEN